MKQNPQTLKRLFIGVPLPPHDIHGHILDFSLLQNQFKHAIPSFRPVKLPHITLFFLGPIPLEIIAFGGLQSTLLLLADAIAKTVKDFKKNAKPIIISFESLVLLGAYKQNIVFLIKDNEYLNQLAQLTKNNICNLPLILKECQQSRDFLVHITIGRIVKDDVVSAQEFLLEFEKRDKQLITAHIDQLVLYESSPDAYIPLISWNLCSND